MMALPMTKSHEPEAVRDIRIQTIDLQINVSDSYVLLAKNSKDLQQFKAFKQKARAAYDEARLLLQSAPLSELQEGTTREQLQLLDDRLKELEAMTNVGP
jgi:hypothetical protein